MSSIMQFEKLFLFVSLQITSAAVETDISIKIKFSLVLKIYYGAQYM